METEEIRRKEIKGKIANFRKKVHDTFIRRCEEEKAMLNESYEIRQEAKGDGIYDEEIKNDLEQINYFVNVITVNKDVFENLFTEQQKENFHYENNIFHDTLDMQDWHDVEKKQDEEVLMKKENITQKKQSVLGRIKGILSGKIVTGTTIPSVIAPNPSESGNIVEELN